MSIPVALDRLAAAVGSVGPGYLLTTSAGRVKVVLVEPVAREDGELLVVGPGGGTLRNLETGPQVTLVFPPAERHGFSLIVDGTGSVAGDDVLVAASGAVWHRPAAHADGPPPPGVEPADGSLTGSPTGCGDDCHPV